MRNQLIARVYDLASMDKDTILMTGDLGYGVLDKLANDMPNQFINAGIAEQNMMSVASGMAKRGKKVFVYSIGNFDTLRCIEQIRNDCCYHNANVKIICVGAGVSYGALGMSHHATEDIAMMRALPNMTIFSPCSRHEVDALFGYIQQDIGTCYIRLGKGGEREIHAAPITNYVLGDPIVMDDKGMVLILATGAIACEAIDAKGVLEARGIKVAMATLPVLKPINEAVLVELLARYKQVITVEEHNVIGGLAGLISEIIARYGISTKLYPIGMPDTYASIVGDRNYLMDRYGFSSQSIVDAITNISEAK